MTGTFRMRPFPLALALLGGGPSLDGEANDDNADNDEQPIMAHEVAGFHNDAGDERQLGMKAFEHFLKARNKEHHQEDENADGQEEQNHRIEHGRHDLAAQIPFAQLEIGNLRQHQVEETAGSPAETMAT